MSETEAPASNVTETSAESGTETTAASGTPAMSHREILEAMTGLIAALFTALLSSTIVINALPTIIGELHASQTAFAWVITTALLANACSTPIWGKLADLFNKKLLVQSAIVIFVIGSVIAGLSHNVATMLVARVVQGIGMGGLTALVVAIIGSIVAPRERGRYSGYMGAAMAVSMTGGPILGGAVVDSPLGWRWCYFICIPLAVIALVLLQRTLHLPTVRKQNVSIDWLGALLLTAGVSVLLVWASFAGKEGYYEWWSRETALYVGIGVALLVVTVIVEALVKEPVIPLKVVSERTTALAITASIAVGIGMFGATTFLGQYLQIARGYSPTAAGLLTTPMVAGMLVSSVISGALISRFGKWKGFVICGAALLVIGYAFLSQIDHATNMWLIGLLITVAGAGTGMMMQNLVLAVQNTVSLKNIGAASSSVAFFRTFGGAIGVSVLGSVLAARVQDISTERFTAMGIPAGSGGGGSLDLKSLPAPILDVVRFAYGDATGRIFLIGTVAAFIAFLATLGLPNRPLRRTIDLDPKQGPDSDSAAGEPPAATETKTLVPDDLTDLDRTPAAPDPFDQRVVAAEQAPVTVGAPPAAERNGRGTYTAADTGPGIPVARLAGDGADVEAFHGRVTRGDGHPVSGAALTLIDQRGHQVARTTGNGDGGFRIGAPGPGEYVLIASATGHRPTAINLTHSTQSRALDLVLDGLGELSGLVRMAGTGTPVPSATVSVTDQRGEVVASAISGADGEFRCDGVVPGTYTLVAVAEHRRPHATAVTVPETGILRHDIELSTMPTLTGSARTDGGRPAPDVQITVLDATGAVTATTRTDEDGRYTVPDLPEGRYTVVARGYPPVTTALTVAGEQSEHDVELGYGTDD